MSNLNNYNTINNSELNLDNNSNNFNRIRSNSFSSSALYSTFLHNDALNFKLSLQHQQPQNQYSTIHLTDLKSLIGDSTSSIINKRLRNARFIDRQDVFSKTMV